MVSLSYKMLLAIFLVALPCVDLYTKLTSSDKQPAKSNRKKKEQKTHPDSKEKLEAIHHHKDNTQKFFISKHNTVGPRLSELSVNRKRKFHKNLRIKIFIHKNI
uniref:Uncharacterized protein n=1 Tax=Strongyloides venezuelensis TaxID=75913 RepID=A0A0K0F700_STRVS